MKASLYAFFDEIEKIAAGPVIVEVPGLTAGAAVMHPQEVLDPSPLTEKVVPAADIRKAIAAREAELVAQGRANPNILASDAPFVIKPTRAALVEKHGPLADILDRQMMRHELTHWLRHKQGKLPIEPAANIRFRDVPMLLREEMAANLAAAGKESTPRLRRVLQVTAPLTSALSTGFALASSKARPIMELARRIR